MKIKLHQMYAYKTEVGEIRPVNVISLDPLLVRFWNQEEKEINAESLIMTWDAWISCGS